MPAYQRTGAGSHLHYLFLATDPVQYTVLDKKRVSENACLVTVAYSNGIRSINVECSYDATSGIRHEKTSFSGFASREEWVFEKAADGWHYSIRCP
jgi:hypothetical protein